MIHVMGPAYHNGEELSTDGRNLSLVLLILSRCAATALWTARLRWPDIRPGHRLASVHVNAEVCLPSNWGRKRGRVAGERATGGENFSAAGAGHWLFTPSHGSSAQNRRQTVFYRYNGACIAREGVTEHMEMGVLQAFHLFLCLTAHDAYRPRPRQAGGRQRILLYIPPHRTGCRPHIYGETGKVKVHKR